MRRNVTISLIMIVLLVLATVGAYLLYNVYGNNDVPQKGNGSPNQNPVDNIEVFYEISVRDELFVTIIATRDDDTFEEEFEMSATVVNTDTLILPNIGTVVLVEETGGEYYGIVIYQLVEDEIISICTIDAASMIPDVIYTVSEANEQKPATITAMKDEDVFELEIAGNITDINVINLGVGLFVFIEDDCSETLIFRLTMSSDTGSILGIKKVGSIQY